MGGDLVVDGDKRQGPKIPSDTTPPRAPRSLRRTSTLDGSHPQGPDGPTSLELMARDLLTGEDGSGTVLGEVGVTATVDPVDGVVDIHATPPDPRLNQLLGQQPFAGWRARIEAILGEDVHQRSLLFLVLDAVPAWARMAAFGLVDEGGNLPTPPTGAEHWRSQVDTCAGWRDGATITLLQRAGRSPALFYRPPAPALDADDSQAWHQALNLIPGAMRRRRRVDVIEGDPLRVDAMFRDTLTTADGEESILHEYVVEGAVDAATLSIVSLEATPNVLPWLECPWAAGSVQALVGRDSRELRTIVRQDMRGTSTCTHLNELLRTFADIGAMAASLAMHA